MVKEIIIVKYADRGRLFSTKDIVTAETPLKQSETPVIPVDLPIR